MAILELFSSRRKKERGETPDVLVYDQLPMTLRNQVILAVLDGLGKSLDEDGFSSLADPVYREIIQQLMRHFGRPRLADGERIEQVLANFLLNESNIEHWLDPVELSFRNMQAFGKNVDY